jgi:hypothetical protein
MLALVVSLTTFTAFVLLVLRVTSRILTEESHVFVASDLGHGTIDGIGEIRAKSDAIV